MDEFKFNLGDEVTDVITKFKGVIRGRTQYLTGCNHYGVQSQKLDKDGNPADWKWFDEQQLKLVKVSKIQLGNAFQTESKTKKGSPGGPLASDQISKTS